MLDTPGGLIVVLVAAGLLGWATGAVAGAKGRDAFLWGLFGAALFIVAFPVVLLLPATKDATASRRRSVQDRQAIEARQQGFVRCPHCLSWMPMAAVVCATCRRDVAAG